MHLCLHGGLHRGIGGVLYIGLITILSFLHLALAGIHAWAAFLGGNIGMEQADSTVLLSGGVCWSYRNAKKMVLVALSYRWCPISEETQASKMSAGKDGGFTRDFGGSWGEGARAWRGTSEQKRQVSDWFYYYYYYLIYLLLFQRWTSWCLCASEWRDACTAPKRGNAVLWHACMHINNVQSWIFTNYHRAVGYRKRISYRLALKINK